MGASRVVYLAVYTKSTAKKKKGWLDGSVTLLDGFVVLKDEDGNEVSKTKLGGHETVKANQENIQIFEGLTCMTLGEDCEAETGEHKLTRKVRHPMRDIKLAVPHPISKAHGGQPLLNLPKAQQARRSIEHMQCTLGHTMPAKKRRFVSLLRSDAVVLEAFTQLAQHPPRSAI